MIRVLIADDEAIIRDGLRAIIELEPDLEVVAEAADGAEAVELAAYRVVQEALTNVIKHAQPRHAHVRVSFGRDELAVEVLDEGELVPTSTSGRGLTGMRERVALYGGVLEVGPRADGGFAVCALFLVASS